QHLQGDVPAERLLRSLVDHAHPAVPDPPEDAELADPLRVGRLDGGDERPGVVGADRLGLLHLDHRREQGANLVAQFRGPGGLLRAGGPWTGTEAADEPLGEPFEWVTVGGRVGHGERPGRGGRRGYESTCAPRPDVHRKTPGSGPDAARLEHASRWGGGLETRALRGGGSPPTPPTAPPRTPPGRTARRAGPPRPRGAPARPPPPPPPRP